MEGNSYFTNNELGNFGSNFDAAVRQGGILDPLLQG